MTESAKARQAWADYLSLGPERSLEAVLKRYQSVAGTPTRRLNTLKAWSATFGWQARLQAIADREAAAAAEREAAHRRAILEDGYGLAHERVDVLKRLAAKLAEELLEGDRLWVQDRKQIGGGEYAQVVDVERFNAAEVEQLRGLLDDIAKEKGERAKKIDVTMRIRELAQRLGKDPDEAVAEAERIIREKREAGRAGSR